MPKNIRNQKARRKRVDKTEAVPLRERIRPIQDRILARPATGLEADKAFFDDLSGEPPDTSAR